MKVILINQEPITVSAAQAENIMKMVMSGTEVILINDELVKASAIMGVRKEHEREMIEKSLWGALPAWSMENFYTERREEKGSGYKKFQEMKRNIMEKLS